MTTNRVLKVGLVAVALIVSARSALAQNGVKPAAAAQAAPHAMPAMPAPDGANHLAGVAPVETVLEGGYSEGVESAPYYCTAGPERRPRLWAQIDYPLYRASVDVLYLDRTVDENQTVAALVNAAAGRIANIDLEQAIDFEQQAGLRVSVERGLSDGMTYAEFKYWGLVHHSEQAQINAVAPININTPNGFNLLTTNSLNVDYGSDLHNGEMNLKHYVTPDTAFLFGFRSLAFTETYRTLEAGTGVIPGGGAGAASGYRRTKAENNAFGLQIGFESAQRFGSRFKAGGYTKAGILGDFYRVRHDQFINTSAIGPISRRIRDSDTDPIGVFETGLDFQYAISGNVTLHAGYMFMAMIQVATATEQPLAGVFNPLVQDADSTSNVLYHGPFFGVEIRWGEL